MAKNGRPNWATTANKQVEILARALGKSWAPVDGFSVGAWTLDNNPVYGGMVIEEYSNAGRGVSQPFGDKRRSPMALCDFLFFTFRAMELLPDMEAKLNAARHMIYEREAAAEKSAKTATPE